MYFTRRFYIYSNYVTKIARCLHRKVRSVTLVVWYILKIQMKATFWSKPRSLTHNMWGALDKLNYIINTLRPPRVIPFSRSLESVLSLHLHIHICILCLPVNSYISLNITFSLFGYHPSILRNNLHVP